MRVLHRSAIVVLLLIAVLLLSSYACALVTFPVAIRPALTGITVEGFLKKLAPADDASPSRGPTIDESDDGRSVHVARGQVLTVQLRETDPGQAWLFAGGDRFMVQSEASSPGQHVFRVKVRGPGELSFAKVDRLSKWTVERFTVRVAIDEKAAEGEPGLSPLSGLAARLPNLLPFYPWRPQQ